VIETLEKSSGMLQNFWALFSIMPIHFKCFRVKAAIVLDYMAL